MGTELKTDSRHRYVLYRREDYTRSLIASDEERQTIDAGRTYTLAAYPDVWTKDVALVQRVRTFLGENFHWHERLAKIGSNLEIVQTLHDMVRSDQSSVVVIPEESLHGNGIAWPPKKAESSFWGVDNYDATPFVSVADRYRAQRERMNAERPTWAETDAMMDGINATFMHAAVLADPLGTLPVFAKAGWISKYGLPDLSGYGADDKSLADSTSTLHGDAQPFEYIPANLSNDATEVAARGVSMTGNQPGGFRINPNGQDVDYFDGSGNLCAQYHESHGSAHGHNFDDRVRDGTHFPMSPINCR